MGRNPRLAKKKEKSRQRATAQRLRSGQRRGPVISTALCRRLCFRQGKQTLHLLGSKHLRKTLTAENHHLLRRPGVGLNEAAGCLQSGSEVLQLLDNLDLAGLAAVLADEDLIRLLQTLNTPVSGGLSNSRVVLTRKGLGDPAPNTCWFLDSPKS